MKPKYQIIFPTDYIEDDLIQFESESKGYLYGVRLKVNKVSYTLTFYEPTRLYQDIEEEIGLHRYFFESNLIVIDKVNKKYIVDTLNNIIRTKIYQNLTPD